MNTNVQQDNSEPQSFDTDDAAAAILSRWEDGADLSEIEDEDATSDNLQDSEVEEDDTDDTPVDEDDDGDEQDPDDEDDSQDDEQDEDADEDDDEPQLATDDSFVELKVNGESKKVSVSDLKRLYGQEASLTKKSQDLAAQRKATDENLARTNASYQKLMERAEARYKPYSDIDMLVASRQMEPDTFAQLRLDARTAEDDLKFLKEESGQMMSELQAQSREATQVAAAACIKVLEEKLPDWGTDLYQEIRQYAVKSGLPQEAVDTYTDPGVIILLNKARLYDQSKQSAESKKASARLLKGKNGKTKILSSKKSAPSKDQDKASRRNKAHQKLIDNPFDNDNDSIAEALMARWED